MIQCKGFGSKAWQRFTASIVLGLFLASCSDPDLKAGSFRSSSSGVDFIQYLPSTNQIVSFSREDDEVSVWSGDEFEPITSFRVNGAWAVQVNEDAQVVTALISDRTSHYDLLSGQKLEEGDSRAARAFLAASGGKQSLVIEDEEDASMVLVKQLPGGSIREFNLPEGNRLRFAFASPSERWIVAKTKGSRALLWDAKTGELVFNRKPFDRYMFDFVFANNENTVIIGGDNGAKAYDVKTGKELHHILPSAGSVFELHVLEDNQTVFASEADDNKQQGRDGRIVFYDLGRGEIKKAYEKTALSNLRVSDSGKFAIGTGYTKEAYIFDFEQPALVRRLEVPGTNAFPSFHSNDTFAVITNQDTRQNVLPTLLFRTKDGQEVLPEDRRKDAIGFAFASDNDTLLSLYPDSELRVWSASSGSTRTEIDFGRNDISTYTISRDGRWMLIGTKSGMLHIVPVE